MSRLARHGPATSLLHVARAAALDRADRLVRSGELEADSQARAATMLEEGYFCALGVAAGGDPVTEEWLRALHEHVCGCQRGQAGFVDVRRIAAAVAGGLPRPSAGMLYPLTGGHYKTDTRRLMSRRQWRRALRTIAPASRVRAGNGRAGRNASIGSRAQL